MNKYAIIMFCNDGEGYCYADHVNMLFDDEKIAEEEMKKLVKTECDSLNEDPPEGRFYTHDEDTVYINNHRLTEYHVIQFTKEINEEKEEINSVINSFSKFYPDVSPKMYNDALCAFEFSFDIDKKEEKYACGSLEKLSIIIGKDYRNSDLIYEIAQNIIDNIDTSFGFPYDVWEESIKNVVGENKYDMAFDEYLPDIPDIFDVIRSYQKDLDFSNRDIEYIEENEKLMSAIFFAIVEYLDDEGIDWCDLDFSKNSTSNWTFELLNRIENTYRNF